MLWKGSLKGFWRYFHLQFKKESCRKKVDGGRKHAFNFPGRILISCCEGKIFMSYRFMFKWFSLHEKIHLFKWNFSSSIQWTRTMKTSHLISKHLQISISWERRCREACVYVLKKINIFECFSEDLSTLRSYIIIYVLFWFQNDKTRQTFWAKSERE